MGLAVAVSAGARPDLSAMLDRMTRAMPHRAPGGWATQVGETAALAARRDRIVGVEGLKIAIHGQCADLDLPAARRMEHPARAVAGPVAFAAWDVVRNRLTVVRDRLGLRPVYYAWSGDCFVVASELAAVLAAIEGRPPLDDLGFAEIAFDMPASNRTTPWSGVFRLPPGHVLAWRDGQVEVTQYWAPELHAPLRYRRHEDYVAHYDALLTAAVDRACDGAGRLACELSGGLDSSGLFARAHERGHEAVPIHLGFSGGQADERSHAREVAARCGADLREVDPALPSLDWYRSFADATGHAPPPPHTAMLTALHQCAAEEGATTLMSGLGGDEWLSGGANGHAAFLGRGDLRGMVGLFAADVRALGIGRALWSLARHGAAPLLPEALRAVLRRSGGPPTDYPPVLREVLAQRTVVNGAVAGARASLVFDPFIVAGREMVELLAARTGLDLVLPFWDVDLVQFSLRVTDGHLFRGGRDKALHRAALAGELPARVLGRDDKAEFSQVFDRFLSEAKADRTWIDPLLERSIVPRQEIDELMRRSRGDGDAVARFRLGALFAASTLIPSR